jgi:hypothetical protein
MQSVKSVPPIPTTIIVTANVKLSITSPYIDAREAVNPMASLTNEFLGMKKSMKKWMDNRRWRATH